MCSDITLACRYLDHILAGVFFRSKGENSVTYDNILKVERDATFHDCGILRLTLNDPNRRNALSEAMLGALDAEFGAASNNPNVRVVILAAAGPVFCAATI